MTATATATTTTTKNNNNMKMNQNTNKLPMDTKRPAADGDSRYDAVDIGVAAAGDAGLLPASRSDPDKLVEGAAFPQRATLHNNPEVQGTADMVERLHAAKRGEGRAGGGHVALPPVRRPHHAPDAAPASVAPAAAAAVASSADASGGHDRERFCGVGYGAAGAAAGAHGLAGGISMLAGIGVNGGLDGGGSGARGAAGAPRGPPPGFADVGVGAGGYASERAPPLAPYNGADKTMGAPTYMPSIAAAGFPAANLPFLYASGAALPGASAAQAMAAHPYTSTGYAGVNTVGARAATAMGFAGLAPAPAAGVGGAAAAAPAVAGLPFMPPVASASVDAFGAAGYFGVATDPAAAAAAAAAGIGAGADGARGSVKNDERTALETEIQPGAPNTEKAAEHLSQAEPTGVEGIGDGGGGNQGDKRGDASENSGGDAGAAVGGGGGGGNGGDGVTGGGPGGKAWGGATSTPQSPDPHVEAVLRAAHCQKFLPLFVARHVDLRRLSAMTDGEFFDLQVSEACDAWYVEKRTPFFGSYVRMQ